MVLATALHLQVRQYQNWGLMPFAAVIGNVYPATYIRGNRFGFGLYPGKWPGSLHACVRYPSVSVAEQLGQATCKPHNTAAEQPAVFAVHGPV
jgi:Replication factor RFC1 C terminal domain